MHLTVLTLAWCNNESMVFSTPLPDSNRSIKGSWLALSSVFYATVIFARSWNALDRFPSDPGYGYFLDAINKGPSVLFSRSEPYLHLLPRLIAEIVVWFPVEWHAIVTATLVNMLWVTCGICVAAVVCLETDSYKFGMLCGLFLLIVPPAMESSIVNIGNVKWPVTVAVFVACCSQRVLRQSLWWLLAAVFLLGLSNPLALVAGLPLLIQVLTTVGLTRQGAVKNFIVLFSAFLIQLSVIGVSAASNGRGASRVLALSNLGPFWWFGLLSPACLAIVVIAIGMSPALRKSSQYYFWSLLSVTAFFLSLARYILGGIADRYFVAPMTLSWLASALLLRQMTVTIPLVGKLLVVTALLLFLVPTVKWFRAGWYLTSGRTWSDQIYDARYFCDTFKIIDFEVSFSPHGTERYECTFLDKDE